jgi:hypothetical protein
LWDMGLSRWHTSKKLSMNLVHVKFEGIFESWATIFLIMSHESDNHKLSMLC